jgi:hypothetical protein
MTSRERFEAWIKLEAKTRAAFRLDPAYVWEAAEAAAVRRCAEWINAWALDSDRHQNMLNSIRAEFPEAFTLTQSTGAKTSL